MQTEASAPLTSETAPSEPSESPTALALLEPRDRNILRTLTWLVLGFVVTLGLVCGHELLYTGVFAPWGRYLWEYPTIGYGSYGTVVLFSMTIHALLLLAGGRLLWENRKDPLPKVALAVAVGAVPVGAVGVWMTWGYYSFIRMATDRHGTVGNLWHWLELTIPEGYPALATVLGPDLGFLLLLLAGGAYLLKQVGYTKESSQWQSATGFTAALTFFLFSYAYHEIQFLILTTVLLIFFLVRAATALRGLLQLLATVSKEQEAAEQPSVAQSPVNPQVAF